MLLKSPEIRFEFRYREVVEVLVVNAQATASINMLNDNNVAFEAKVSSISEIRTHRL